MPSIEEDVVQLENLYIALGNVRCYNDVEKSFLVSYKVKHTLIILFSNSTHWQITLKRSELIPTKRTMTRSSNQCSENRSPVLGRQVLFAHPCSHKLCASCCRNRCTATCSVVRVVDGVCVAATVLKAEIDCN